MSKPKMLVPDMWRGRGRYKVTRKQLAELKRAGGEIHRNGKSSGEVSEARGLHQPEPPCEEIIASQGYRGRLR